MGFEEDYCQGLRDKCWGRAIKAFATGESNDKVSRLIKEALSAAWRVKARSGAEASFLKAVEKYVTAHAQAQVISQSLMILSPDTKQGVIDNFVDACGPIIRDEENSDAILRLLTLGVDGLYAYCTFSTRARC